MPIADPDYKTKCSHLGTYPPIIENLLSVQYRDWRWKILEQLFRIAEATSVVGAISEDVETVSVAAICRQGKHWSTATGWYMEEALRSAGYKVGYQHLSWFAQDGVWCQRSTGRRCLACSRDNPELIPLKKRVHAESREVREHMRWVLSAH
jgi:hypothetical protein